MAKTTNKTSAPKTEKKSVAKPKASKTTSTDLLEKASVEALKKLQSLGIEEQLQSELEWCLGSYRFDKNPTGLYEVAGRALNALNAEKSKKTKGVTIKLIDELEKAIKNQ